MKEREQEKPPSVTESALSRFQYDAIVSYNSFRIATLLRDIISSVCFVCAFILFVYCVHFDVDEFSAGRDAIILNFPAILDPTPFGQCNPRGILERYFAALFPRRLLQLAWPSSSARASPAGAWSNW